MALISLRNFLVATVCLAIAAPVNAGYYIEYMREPCMDYDACAKPCRHAYVPKKRHHVKHHKVKKHYAKRCYRPRSSYSISVNYYWSVYPVYDCADTCVPCRPSRQWTSCGGGCRDRVAYYRDYDYLDVDYDTATADDGYRPCADF